MYKIDQKTPVLNSSFNQVADYRSANLIRRHFNTSVKVNFAKIFSEQFFFEKHQAVTNDIQRQHHIYQSQRERELSGRVLYKFCSEKKYANFAGKYLCLSLFLNKVADFIKNPKNTHFVENLQMAASLSNANISVQGKDSKLLEIFILICKQVSI